MTKDNILFSIIGVLLGFIVGFMFANTVNQRGTLATPQSQRVSPTNSALAQNPNLPPNHPALPSNAVADQEQLLGSVQTAIEEAKKDPNNFDAQMRAAELHYKIQRYNEAIEYLLRANQLRPESYEAVVALGNVNYDAGNYQAAERWYTAALVKNPDDVNVRTDLGLTFFLREPSTPANIDRAITEFRRSLEREPQHEPTLQNLTAALTRKGDIAESEATLAKLEEVNSQNESIGKLRAQIEKARASTKSQPSAVANKKQR